MRRFHRPEPILVLLRRMARVPVRVTRSRARDTSPKGKTAPSALRRSIFPTLSRAISRSLTCDTGPLAPSLAHPLLADYRSGSHTRETSSVPYPFRACEPEAVHGKRRDVSVTASSSWAELATRWRGPRRRVASRAASPSAGVGRPGPRDSSSRKRVQGRLRWGGYGAAVVV